MASVTWRSSAGRNLSVFLLRHAEAHKNTEDRHGGGNPRLTELGKLHCRFIRDHLENVELVDPNRTAVYFHPCVQVQETVTGTDLAECSIAKGLDGLRGIDLGELAGLSRTEAAMRYSGAASLLEQWRSGRLKLPDLILPGGELAEEFALRVQGVFKSILDRLPSAIDNVILAGTRSTLILLHNSLLLDADFDFDDYRPWEFANGSLTRWELFDDRPPQLAFFNLVPAVRTKPR